MRSFSNMACMFLSKCFSFELLKPTFRDGFLSFKEFRSHKFYSFDLLFPVSLQCFLLFCPGQQLPRGPVEIFCLHSPRLLKMMTYHHLNGCPLYGLERPSQLSSPCSSSPSYLDIIRVLKQFFLEIKFFDERNLTVLWHMVFGAYGILSKCVSNSEKLIIFGSHFSIVLGFSIVLLLEKALEFLSHNHQPFYNSFYQPFHQS